MTISAISSNFVEKHCIPTERLECPVHITNVDGTQNAHGLHTHIVTIRLRLLDHEEWVTLQVSKLKDFDIFLGYDWFLKHNPSIDWNLRHIQFNRCPSECIQHDLLVWKEHFPEQYAIRGYLTLEE